VLSQRKARRSPFPAAPSVAPEMINLQSGPRLARSRLSAAGLRRDSWTATTSNWEMTAARQAIACQSRFGESFAPASHLAVDPPVRGCYTFRPRGLYQFWRVWRRRKLPEAGPGLQLPPPEAAQSCLPYKQTGHRIQAGALASRPP
jgi:hypothetical protein